MICGCLWPDVPSRWRMQVVSGQLSHHSIQWAMGGRMGKIPEDEMGLICVEGRACFWKNSQAELISRAVDTGDQSWSAMAACSPCHSTWVNCQTNWCWGRSLKMAKKMLTLTSTWSDEQIGVRKSNIHCRRSLSSPNPEGGICHWQKSGSKSSQIK